MFCKYCGYEIDDDSSFCKNCGKSLVEESHKDSNNDFGFLKKNSLVISLMAIWLLFAAIYSIERAADFVYVLTSFFVFFLVFCLTIAVFLLFFWLCDKYCKIKFLFPARSESLSARIIKISYVLYSLVIPFICMSGSGDIESYLIKMLKFWVIPTIIIFLFSYFSKSNKRFE